MQQLTFVEMRDFVAARLPRRYEPLLLKFYGHGIRQTGDDVIIGDDEATELRVRPDGTLVSMDPAGQLPTRFLNSSLEQLAQFLEVVASTDRTDDNAERVMWSRLSTIDPPAFANEENC